MTAHKNARIGGTMTGGTEKAGTLDKDTAVPASSSILAYFLSFRSNHSQTPAAATAKSKIKNAMSAVSGWSVILRVILAKHHLLQFQSCRTMYLGCGNPAPFRRFAVSKLTMFFIVV